MKKTGNEILLFAGTTEGRMLSDFLVSIGAAHTICVATEYGEIVLKNHPLAKVRRGRMGQEEIREFIRKGDFLAVVDATHPYAEQITRNIREAMNGMDIPYLRLKREEICEKPEQMQIDAEKICFFQTKEECAKALENVKGNILLTIGSKELSRYCISEEIRKRLYVRVLPSVESLSICIEQGISGKQIIAMQGPFTVEMNEAVIRQYHISCMVTKESGKNGGYQEKLKAAEHTGVQVFVVGRPIEETGLSLEEVCRKLESLCRKYSLENPIQNESEVKLFPEECKIEIILAGIGMGGADTLTNAVRGAVAQADILLGAERMLALFPAKTEKHPFYLAEQILPYLVELQENMPAHDQKKVVVLFSGDSGFYSGCQSLYRKLQTGISEGRLHADILILPGISSIAYLAACIGESYQDAAIYSMHGKALCNLAGRIRSSRKTFLLMSGVRDINHLGHTLLEADLTQCEVTIGYQLSYHEQQVRMCTPRECCDIKEEGLYTCFVKNPEAMSKKLTPGMADQSLVRDKVPMTKEEIREISICKMRLHDQAVVYDIGSGTGSVAVETAAVSDGIQVYAIEKKREAVFLIQKNKEQFHLENITIVEADAPEWPDGLPAATHAFIGGSGGRLKEILTALYQVNPYMRIVINAVTMETIGEIQEILSTFPIKEDEVVQVQVSRARKAGNYHLMQAENPIWICSFEFCSNEMMGENV